MISLFFSLELTRINKQLINNCIHHYLDAHIVTYGYILGVNVALVVVCSGGPIVVWVYVLVISPSVVWVHMSVVMVTFGGTSAWTNE